MRRLALFLASACLCACTATPWETYDETSYAAVMDPTDEAVAEHIALLEKWVAGPAEDVPAGIPVELAYWLAKVGHTEEARKLFEAEIVRYPHAEKYVRMLMNLVLPLVAPEPKA